MLPQDLPAADVAKGKWSRAGSELRLSVTSATLANYPVADFYPLPEGNIVVGHPKIESRTGNEITFAIPIESASKDLLSMKGLIVFAQRANGNDRAAWRVAESGAVSPANSVPARGVLTFLFFGFLGGLILNLMPCVLPDLAQDLRIHSARRPEPSKNLAQRPRLRGRNLRLVCWSGAAFDCSESRRPRSHLGWLSVHQPLFRSFAERHRSCFCPESFRRLRNFAAANGHARIAELDGGRR